MNKLQRQVYDAMLSGFAETAAGIRILRPDTEGFGGKGNSFGDIFFRLRLDHPEIFYVTGCGFRCARDSDFAELVPEYMFDRARIKEHRRAIDARVTKLLRPAQGMSEAEKEKFIHDFICSSVRYDKLKKPYSHEVIGPLQNGVGVCEGIAKTVKLMCDRLGIECLVAIGDRDPEGDSDYLHAWNIVKIGGKYYHLDATFDNSLGKGGEIRYDYFNLDDGRVFRDHRAPIYALPECRDGGMFYYKTAGLSFTRTEDVAARANRALRKKQPGLTFHWRGGPLTRTALGDIVSAVDAAAEARGRKASYSVNFPQAVIRACFSDYAGGITEEHADEGQTTAAAPEERRADAQ